MTDAVPADTTVAVVPAGTPSEAARTRAGRIGARVVVAEEEVGLLGEAVTASEDAPVDPTTIRDEPVDPDRSVNDPRGPSIDLRTTKAKAKKKGAPGQERLAHRGCNTGKGANDPVVPWPEHLFVVDPAVILRDQ